MGETACPKCGETIEVVDARQSGRQLVITGRCPRDGIVEIVD